MTPLVLDGPVLPLIALIWPLVLGLAAALPAIRTHAITLLPLAPLPALLLALVAMTGAGSGAETVVGFVLLGVVLGQPPLGMLLLGMTAFLWLAAGVYAVAYMRSARRPAVFTGFWCLTLAGNLGVFLAQDIITFYVAFAAVSLAAYVLVVEAASKEALRAGRIYLTLAVLGEACLLAGFTIGAAAADTLRIEDMRAALPQAPLGGLAGWLLLAGFGLKAGLVPLHIWLPLAHPVAPTPASAVLSGAIVKAGVIGLILFLPPGTGLAGVLVTAGLFGAFAAALYGLSQANPKAILAYSTISQMGLVMALIGAALTAGSGMEQAGFYAFHHGLAKAALFLSVGVVAGAAGGRRVAALGLAALAALSVAGAPLSGGALVKAAGKPVLAGGAGATAEMLMTISGITTTLLLGWFLIRLSREATPEGKHSAGRSDWRLWAPVLALSLGAVLLPWGLWSDWSGGLGPDYPWRGTTLLAAAWPVATGLAAGLLANWRGLVMPRLPTGDLAPMLERAVLTTIRQAERADTARRSLAQKTVTSPLPRSLGNQTGQLVARLEAALGQWRWSGLAALVLILVLAGFM
ncbi:complex I subunit 5 family protein [Alkalilacustris brevis]|uniref:complex I subunit 5 family protein n=1 Tax=Alkalilacustris brevis TaxID=2026338 RepID=UPI000E0DA0A9|nr:complex I subunit 5 family protein [Alkalilacustris brevis]